MHEPRVQASASGEGKSDEEQPSGVEHEAAILSELAKIPSITGAWIGSPSEHGNTLVAQFAQRDLVGNKVRKFFRSFHLPKEWSGNTVTAEASFPTELQNTLLQSVSPSGKNQIIVKFDNDTTIFELWSGSRLSKEVHVPKQVHGRIYSDNWFGLGLAWSPNEEKLAYVAEAVPKSKTPEWGVNSGTESRDANASKNSSAPKAGPKGWRGIGEFQEDWGELNTGRKIPALFVLDLGSDSVTPVKGLPENASSGQPIWNPDGKGLVFVAWPHRSLNFPNLTQRLGVAFCVNRPCFLYQKSDFSSEEEAKKVETGLQSHISPQFSPDGSYLYFLSYETAVRSGAHFATASINRLPLQSGRLDDKVEVVVEVAQSSKNYDEFPGLYCIALKPSLLEFISNDRFLVTSVWRSSAQVLDIEISKGKGVVRRSTKIGQQYTSSAVLTAKHGLVLAVTSGPRRAPNLSVAKITDGSLDWKLIEFEDTSYDSLIAEAVTSNESGYKILTVNNDASSDGGFEAVFLENIAAKKGAPTVLILHGGPHAIFLNAYLMSNLYFNILGYNILQVNYRGSIGFGEAVVQSLPGNIGQNDVKDCIAALDQAVSKGLVDPEHVAVVGGSHGGFLTGHLLGQYPKKFKAGVSRNPVLDVALMSQISDIPDWCFIEGFGSKEGLQKARVKPSEEDARHLTSISPIRYVDQIEAPVLFMLGAKDRRVVMKDAHQYIAALRARSDSPPHKVIVFPEDTHALDRPQTEYEQWVNAAWWIKQYI